MHPLNWDETGEQILLQKEGAALGKTSLRQVTPNSKAGRGPGGPPPGPKPSPTLPLACHPGNPVQKAQSQAPPRHAHPACFAERGGARKGGNKWLPACHPILRGWGIRHSRTPLQRGRGSRKAAGGVPPVVIAHSRSCPHFFKPPLSPQTCANCRAGPALRRPIVEQETDREGRGENSHFPSEAS